MANARLATGPLRVLPVTIAAVALTFALRVGELWTEVGLGFSGQAVAQAGSDEMILPSAGPERDTDSHAVEDAEPSHSDASAEYTDDYVRPETAQGVSEADVPADPASGDARLPLPDLVGSVAFSPAEVEVLTELAKRREGLDGRERELGLREGLLQAAEQRLDDKIAELQELRSEIEALVRQHDEQEEAELQSLVKIYQTMKPKDAARILQELDLPILLSIMERMKERSTAPILAAMDPGRAREVTTELAQRRELGVPSG